MDPGSYDTHVCCRGEIVFEGWPEKEKPTVLLHNFIFFEVLIGAAALEASAFARVIDIKLIVIRRVIVAHEQQPYDFPVNELF